MLKKVVIFLGRQILKLGFFLGIKYEPLLDPPPPPTPLSLTIVSGAPGVLPFNNVCKVSTVGKISDCQPGGPWFNPRPG